MILALIEFVVLVVFAIYVEWWRAGERKRQAQVWDRLAAQLQPNWFGEGLSDQLNGQLSWSPDQTATPEQRWQKVQGAQGLWAIYENARVLLDMANQTADSSSAVDQELLTAMRKDAMEIRVCVLVALSKYASNQVNESSCENVARTASLYSDMAGRMAQLMRLHRGAAAPPLAGVA